jgi:hypothetical protein
MNKTKDEVLLDEILSICSKESKNGDFILKKLTLGSKSHLLSNHTKLGVFMKTHQKHFETPSNGMWLTKRNPNPTKPVQKEKPVNLDISVKNLFLEHFDSEKWVLLNMAFDWLTKEQKSALIMGYDGVLKFVEHHSNIFEIDRHSKALAIRLKKSFEKEMKKIEKETQKKPESKNILKIESKETKESILLNEILEICSKEPQNGSSLLNKLSTESHEHLIQKYIKLGQFMNSHTNYFETSPGGKYFTIKPVEKKSKELILKEIKQETKQEIKQEIKPTLKNFIYSLDFETDVNTPIEIGCVKIEVKTGKIVEYFHELINPGHLQRSQGSEWGRKNIHGLPYYNMNTLSKKSIETIWNDFLKFIEYEKDPNKILFAKGKKTENNVINWFKKQTKWKKILKVIDLFEIIQFYEPSLSRSEAMEIELHATTYLEPVRKCKHHSTLNPLFHCALEDAFANAIFLQHGIEKSFSQFLTKDRIKRATINESKRPSEIEAKKLITETISETIQIKSIVENKKVSKPLEKEIIGNLKTEIESKTKIKLGETSNQKEIKNNSLKETKGSLNKDFEIIEYFEPQIRNIPPIKINENEVLELLKILPPKYFEFFHDKDYNDLVDIEMDFNRIPKAHFFQREKLIISDELVTKEDLEYITKNLNILPNNRTGIEKYLHRISIIRSIENEIIGVTLRVGKPIVGIANVISDILDEKKSILFLGPPGI